MQKRIYNIGRASAGRCLIAAALLAAAAFAGCTPASPENNDNDKPGKELSGSDISINVSGSGAIGDYTTKAASSPRQRYTVQGNLTCSNASENETFEVIIMPNEVPSGFQPATRASYGAISGDTGNKSQAIRWDEGDKISVFSDEATHDAKYTNSGSLNQIAYCNYDIKEEPAAQGGFKATASPVAGAPFNGRGLQWSAGKAHRFIGIWPPVDTLARLKTARIAKEGTQDQLSLTFPVCYTAEQKAYDASSSSSSGENVYSVDLSKVMMYSGYSVSAENAKAGTDVDLLFRPAFTSLEFSLKKKTDDKTMKVQWVEVKSQENYLASNSEENFSGTILHGVNAAGNTETSFQLDPVDLTDGICSKSVRVEFYNGNDKVQPELTTDKATRFCILALPHQIGTLTIFIDLEVGGVPVTRQLDLRILKNGVSEWINVPACSKVIINNLAIPTSVDKGLEPKPFSVSPIKTVTFSSGNLQAKKNAGSTLISAAYQWRFSPTQYSVIADNGSNTNIPTTNAAESDWIDLFGWSGEYNNNRSAWGVRASNRLLLSYYRGPYANWDINTNFTAALNTGWGLLSKNEIEYLLGNVLSPAPSEYRTNADKKASLATVGEVKGIVILPDDWTLPNHCSFTPIASDYTTNTYSTAGAPGTSGSWTQMERAGAVFLPMAGYTSADSGTDTYYPDVLQYQISTSINDESYLALTVNSSGKIAANQTISNNEGSAVRLVKAPYITTPIDYTGPGVTPASHLFTVLSNGTKVQFTTSNLMWDAGNKQFRLMDNPWSIIEASGTSIGTRSINEDIGLFKWAASGEQNLWPWTTKTNSTEFGPNKRFFATRIDGYYWDWGDNVVYDAQGDQMTAPRQQSRLRTLESREWMYLLFERTCANRFEFAKVNDIGGLVIFSDDYTHPSNVIAIKYANKKLSEIYHDLNRVWSRMVNNYTIEQFGYMAAAGAVFLPGAGYTSDETGNMVTYTGSTTVDNRPELFYWTSTPKVGDASQAMPFTSFYFDPTEQNGIDRNASMSVRLVYHKGYEGIALTEN